MVKPALPYLDIIREVKMPSGTGERLYQRGYAMIKQPQRWAGSTGKAILRPLPLSRGPAPTLSLPICQGCGEIANH